MQSKMLHRASLILGLFVWFAENAAALQSLDRQQECSDQVACGFATATFGCNAGWVSARCPKTCGSCNAADSVCEDSDSRCDLLFEHPELTGVKPINVNLLMIHFVICVFVLSAKLCPNNVWDRIWRREVGWHLQEDVQYLPFIKVGRLFQSIKIRV